MRRKLTAYLMALPARRACMAGLCGRQGRLPRSGQEFRAVRALPDDPTESHGESP
jgi:hypothetical protein